MLKFKTHSSFHDLFEYKYDKYTLIGRRQFIFTFAENVAHNMLSMQKSGTFTDPCTNEIIPLINRSFVYKAKEGRHVRIKFRFLLFLLIFCGDALASNDITHGVTPGFVF